MGICGQAPSDHPEIVRFFVERGIDSISLNPDALFRGREAVATAEAARHMLQQSTPGGQP